MQRKAELAYLWQILLERSIQTEKNKHSEGHIFLHMHKQCNILFLDMKGRKRQQIFLQASSTIKVFHKYQ